jgi:hypothetical protein
VLVVLAARHDRAAEALVRRWATAEARLLTPDDLSRAGWRHQPSDPANSTAVVGGQRVAVCDISGVLTRLPAVTWRELAWIVPEDRRYVAQEMTAFLLSWLCGLECPVINVPTPTGLCGPSWRPERWRIVAAKLGINVTPLRRRASMVVRDAIFNATVDAYLGSSKRGCVPVTVIGDRCIGAADEALASQAWHLARAAGADILVVRFDGREADSCFVNADFWPDVSDGDVADAVFDLFAERTRVSSGVGTPK